MTQNVDSCDCNDYSQQTAQTGMATISVPNPNVDGTGPKQLVLTASQNGTHINMIKVVATQATTAGIVRIFIQDPGATQTILYMEIPIPICPAISSAVVGSPVVSMFEATMGVALNLPSGYKLYASTKNGETFNVFATGYSWAYPAEVPGACCSFTQYTATFGLGTVSVANTNLNGSGVIVPIYTSPTGLGSIIDYISLNALQTISPGMIRLFISSDGGTTYSLFQEIWIPEYVLSASTPTFANLFNSLISYLQGDYIIGASTELAQNFAIKIAGRSWTYPI